jgi:hypothetical protein
METPAFFTRDGAAFVPTTASAGFWAPNSLHGRVVIGLLAFAIERDHGAPEFQIARFTVDMYRLPDRSPLTVTTRVVRGGRRIKVIDAEVFSGEVSVARATSQLLHRTDVPAGNVWSPPNWEVPAPDTIAPAPDVGPKVWARRAITGAVGTLGPRRIWMSETRELIDGEPLTPFVRVALAADFTSPFANAGDQGLSYINSDVTVYLHRNPKTAWVGFEVVNHQASDGVAIGECFLYDEVGPIGSATVTALAQARKPVDPGAG